MFSFLSQQTLLFFATNTCYVCCDKKSICRNKKSYLCELQPVMIKTVSEKTFR